MIAYWLFMGCIYLVVIIHQLIRIAEALEDLS